MSRVAGACSVPASVLLPASPRLVDAAYPAHRQQSIEATTQWFDGANLLGGKREQRTAIT